MALGFKTAAEPDPAHEALVHFLQEAIPTGIDPADTFDYAGAARAEAEAIRTDYELRRNYSHNYLSLAPTHLCFTAASFYDQTDRHNELVFERQWLLHPSEETLILSGNLFFAENSLTKNGLVFLKAAPLPNARPEKSVSDVWVWAAHRTLTFQSDGYETVTIAYSGGKWGRIAALQNYQRQIRPYVPGRDGLLLSNTWGDRNRDGRINEDFLRREINAGARLGVDILQIDDGWQKGTTLNSVDAKAKNGVWEGFHKSDSAFWDVNPDRFPQGLAPLAQAARVQKMRLGLWFAPDSDDDFANFQKDADRLLRLHREFGINDIKIDGVKLRSKKGEQNLQAFFDRVLEGSDGSVVFDGDVTAEVRPGYFGMMDTGPIFVENRYTDWHGYWPHHTLRNLWNLSHYLDPVRLRMEFLNNGRTVQKYQNDPLAPHTYRPDYLFATVMFAAPLGWFEVSELAPDYFEAVGPLIAVWKKHRDALHTGTIFPIGDAPDGTAWTGFASVARDRKTAYVLIFRELPEAGEATLFVPHFDGAGEAVQIEKLAGEGAVSWAGGSNAGGQITVRLPKQRFVWVRLTCAA